MFNSHVYYSSIQKDLQRPSYDNESVSFMKVEKNQLLHNICLIYYRKNGTVDRLVRRLLTIDYCTVRYLITSICPCCA
jgi:hypothetical protein